MRVVLDGSVCFDRFGACFTYHMQLVPRLVARGCAVTVTPSPTGALDALNGSGAQVTQTLLPTGSWLPQGRLRQSLSKVKQRVEKWRWGRKLDAGEPVIFQSFYYGLPAREDAVFVPMIVDMIQEKFPHLYQNPQQVALKAECARRAKRIITISEASKRDIVDILKVPEDRIDVIYLGVDPCFLQDVSEQVLAETKQRLGLPKPYFIQVGGRASHKNFGRLLEAFARHTASDDIDLVCAGEVWDPTEVEAMERLGLKARVHLIHRPSQTELVRLMKGSEGLVYPSLYEGFGIPPVEAMACGIPVAASKGGSIGEVTGDAAASFDPFSIEEITAALARLRDPLQATELKRRGALRFQEFNWDRIADQTIATYRRALLERTSSMSYLSGGEKNARATEVPNGIR